MYNPPLNIGFDNKVYNPVYIPTYTNTDRMLWLYGGAGSGKSEWAAQKILLRMMRGKKHRFLLTRKVLASIRTSQFQLLKDVADRWGVSHLFEFRSGNLSVKCKKNGNTAISKGMDDVEKIKSIAGITGIWAEELTEFTEQDVTQLNLRLRGIGGSYKQFIGTFNTIDIDHWIRERYFPEGDSASNIHRFDIGTDEETLEPLYGTALRTTYLDNKFIDSKYKSVLAGLARQDENYYRIYALGRWGVKTEGLYYKKWQLVDSMPTGLDYECYGLDFGYSNAAALIHIGIRAGEIFIHEVIYQKGLTNPELIAKMKDLGISTNTEIFADAASADKIQEIYNAGFNIHAANKNVQHGIEIVQSLPMLNITDSSSNVVREIKRYSRKTDKNGKLIDEPIKFDDHSMDAIRYAIYTAWMTYGEMVFGNTPRSTYTPTKRESTSRSSSKYDSY